MVDLMLDWFVIVVYDLHLSEQLSDLILLGDNSVKNLFGDLRTC